MRDDIRKLVDQTPIVDTHEHIIEEKNRLNPGNHWRMDDIGVLFTHYLDSDLLVAGMPQEDLNKVFLRETPPDRKWELVKPWWEKTRNTGYGLCVREAVEALFGETDITDANWRTINDKVHALIKPGYYNQVLKSVSNIDHCQVNSLEVSPFCETSYPDLLLQDISFVPMSTGLDVPHLAQKSGIEVKTLDDWYQVIEWCFATYGPRAVAVKNQSAYGRKLDYDRVSKDDAAYVFDRYVQSGFKMQGAERKSLEDHLFHYCVDKAAEYHLPVKLHTGYYAGQNYMPLHRLRHNAGDMCALCQSHPNASFVFMHITYPYQSEAIAVAKHYRNAYLDMCWAWIINPAAGVRFLKEFLMAAPANKVFTFGGDYGPVELVPGHARIARRGIVQALSELVEEKWIREGDVPYLVERLLRGNAYDLFEINRCRTHAMV